MLIKSDIIEETDLTKIPYIDRRLVIISERKPMFTRWLEGRTKSARAGVNLIKQIGGNRATSLIDKVEESPVVEKIKKDSSALGKYFDTVSNAEYNPGVGIAIVGLIFGIKSKNRQYVQRISREQASLITFPLGHPINEVVYVGHPADPCIYYPIADFHRRVFEHKLSEAVRLLTDLGATSLRAEHISGWSRDFSSKLSIPISNEIGEVTLDGSSTSKINSSILFTASYPVNKNPHLSQNLSWYHHEPNWVSVADGRLKNGMKGFSLIVSYVDDFGVNFDLKTSIMSAKLGLGGSFEGHQSTTWKLEGTFE